MGGKRFPVFAWGVLAYALAVIGWGYFLRVSESGDGCGTDWPLCNGAVVPAEAQFPTWVEYTHRLSSGIVLVLVLAMVIWAMRSYGRGHAVRRAAMAALVLTVSESLFGALLVVFGWVAGDVSVGRILIRPFHVTNTFLLMAALGLTAWWSSRRVTEWTILRHPDARRLWPGAVALIALAATGSWTGLAGTAFPVESLGEGIGQYLNPEHLLIYLRTVHPILAVASLFLLVRITIHGRARPTDSAARRLTTAILSLAVVQMLVGPLTILLLHPTALRLIHLLLGDLLWISLVFLWSAAGEPRRLTPERSYSPSPSSEKSQPGAALP